VNIDIVVDGDGGDDDGGKAAAELLSSSTIYGTHSDCAWWTADGQQAILICK
jgi:hypothetical protein